MDFQPATETDAIAGVRPRFIATPRSTAEASTMVQAAARDNLAVVVRGSGTKQDWAAPPSRLDLVIDTRNLTGIVEHAAGDLVVVVRAGTPIAELQAALALAGQQLAIDTPTTRSHTAPAASANAMPGAMAGASVGGVVAANVSGPRRLAYGTIRDLLIGVTIVRPDGAIAKAGGKVVKNVAGYDLGKLFTGSFGTLGLISECAFRLHPLPANSIYVTLPASEIRAMSQLVPSAVEVNAMPGAEPEYIALFEGDAAAARAGGFPVCARPSWWNTYPWAPGEIGLKATAALSKVPALLAFASANGIHIRGSIATGVLHAILPTSVSASTSAATDVAATGKAAAGIAALGESAALVARFREAVHDAGGFLTVVTAPPTMHGQLDLWGPVPGLDLMRRIKQQFDPAGSFAPGRFVGGI